MTEAFVDAIAANRPNRIVNDGHRVIVRKASDAKSGRGSASTNAIATTADRADVV